MDKNINMEYKPLLKKYTAKVKDRDLARQLFGESFIILGKETEALEKASLYGYSITWVAT